MSSLHKIYSLILLIFCIGITISRRHSKYDRDSSIGGTGRRHQKNLKVITFQKEPYVTLRWEPSAIGNDRYDGYYVKLLSKVSNEVKFQYQLNLAAVDKIGKLDHETGEWDGLLAYLNEGKADMVLAPIVQTHDRSKDFIFSEPVGHTGVSMLGCKSCSSMWNGQEPPMAMIRGSEAEEILKQSTNEEVRSILTDIESQGHYIGSIQDGVEKVRTGEIRLILESDFALYYGNQEPCDLHIVKQFEVVANYSFAFRKKTSLTEDISNMIKKLKDDNNLWDSLKGDWTMACLEHMDMNKPEEAIVIDAPKISDLEAQKTLSIDVAAVEVAPFLMRANAENNQFEGYIVDLLDEMALRAPFSYNINLVNANHMHRGKRTKKIWTEIANELLEGTANVGAAPFMPSKKQERTLTFSRPYLHSTIAMLIKSPDSDVSVVPVSFIEDMINQTDIVIKMVVVLGDDTYKTLESATKGIEKQIWEIISSNKKDFVVKSIDEALRKVRSGGYALLIQSTESAYIAAQKPCDLMSLDQLISMTFYMFAVKRDNSLVTLLDDVILTLRQEGFLQILYQRWWGSDECTDVTVNEEIIKDDNNVSTEDSDVKGSLNINEPFISTTMTSIYHDIGLEFDQGLERISKTTNISDRIPPTGSDVILGRVFIPFNDVLAPYHDVHDERADNHQWDWSKNDTVTSEMIYYDDPNARIIDDSQFRSFYFQNEKKNSSLNKSNGNVTRKTSDNVDFTLFHKLSNESKNTSTIANKNDDHVLNVTDNYTGFFEVTIPVLEDEENRFSGHIENVVDHLPHTNESIANDSIIERDTIDAAPLKNKRKRNKNRNEINNEFSHNSDIENNGINEIVGIIISEKYEDSHNMTDSPNNALVPVLSGHLDFQKSVETVFNNLTNVTFSVVRVEKKKKKNNQRNKQRRKKKKKNKNNEITDDSSDESKEKNSIKNSDEDRLSYTVTPLLNPAEGLQNKRKKTRHKNHKSNKQFGRSHRDNQRYKIDKEKIKQELERNANFNEEIKDDSEIQIIFSDLHIEKTNDDLRIINNSNCKDSSIYSLLLTVTLWFTFFSSDYLIL